MTEQNQNTEIGALRQRYQAIKAPPFLVTRVLGTVAKRPRGQFGWRWAVVVGAAMVGLLVALPLWEQDVTPLAGPTYPSLSALARSMPTKPTAPIPSLASLGSVAIPAMPVLPPIPTQGEPTG